MSWEAQTGKICFLINPLTNFHEFWDPEMGKYNPYIGLVPIELIVWVVKPQSTVNRLCLFSYTLTRIISHNCPCFFCSVLLSQLWALVQQASHRLAWYPWRLCCHQLDCPLKAYHCYWFLIGFCKCTRNQFQILNTFGKCGHFDDLIFTSSKGFLRF